MMKGLPKMKMSLLYAISKGSIMMLEGQISTETYHLPLIGGGEKSKLYKYQNSETRECLFQEIQNPILFKSDFHSQ